MKTTLEIYEDILILNNFKLDVLNTNIISQYSELESNEGLRDNWGTSYFHSQSGKEHYRLLIELSSYFNNEILFDIGTNRCMSAIALSKNKTNKIKSYDIVQQLPINPNVENIQFIIGDSTKDEDLQKSRFIFLDVDHDGIYEEILFNHLRSIGWKGLIILDDIKLNEPMSIFWNSITERKADLTPIGHWSGTGMVLFQ